jgi:hypothetical protein
VDEIVLLQLILSTSKNTSGNYICIACNIRGIKNNEYKRILHFAFSFVLMFDQPEDKIADLITHNMTNDIHKFLITRGKFIC